MPGRDDFLRELRDIHKFDRYCAKFLKIQTKDTGLQPLVLNASQIKLLNAVIDAYDNGKPLHFILLKARQIGFSTFVEALIYWLTTMTDDFRSVIIAHETGASTKLYDMFRTYQKHFPKELRAEMSSPGNRKGMKFEKIRSSIEVHTAGAALSTSSGTYQAAHISELSKWDNPEEAMLSLMQTLPGNAFVIVESTAYGVGNYYYRFWNDAVNGYRDFIPLFFPWHEHDEYQLDKYINSRGDRIDVEPSKEERYYVEKFKLSQRQLNWMRWAFENKCDKNWDLFRQEYPSEPDEAFLTTGRPYFNLGALRSIEIDLIKTPPKEHRGTLLWDGKGNPIFDPDIYSDVVIYEHPLPKDNWANRYTIGADFSEGMKKDADGSRKRSGDTDFNAAFVWDRVTKRQVAEIRNKLDPDEFGEQLVMLQSYYGGNMSRSFYPLIVPERNSAGLTGIVRMRDVMRDHKIPTTRIYHQMVLDEHAEVPLEKLGWRTQPDNKDELTGLARTAIRNHIDEDKPVPSGIRSLGLVDECKTFVYLDVRKTGAQSSRWDDRVIAYSLALEGDRVDILPRRVIVPHQLTGWRKDIFKRVPSRRKGIGYWG